MALSRLLFGLSIRSVSTKQSVFELLGFAHSVTDISNTQNTPEYKEYTCYKRVIYNIGTEILMLTSNLHNSALRGRAETSLSGI